jgi:hypothetical protein
MNVLAQIKQLYSRATRATIQRDMARAVELLKSLPTELERERAAVYMDGLSQMRSEWAMRGPGSSPTAPSRAKARGPGTRGGGRKKS